MCCFPYGATSTFLLLSAAQVALGGAAGRGLSEVNFADIDLLHQSCSGLANFTSADSPLVEYSKTVQSWLNNESSPYQISVALAALVVGLCLTWDGPQMWQALFTLALSLSAALAGCFEANEQQLPIFSVGSLMFQAAVTVGLAVYWGFEGSQVLLGACCGFAGAYGMSGWIRIMDAVTPGVAMLWYVAGAVFGILIFTTWRRSMLACLAPVLGSLLVASSVGVLISRLGLRTPFLPQDNESWLEATEALLGLNTSSSLALFGLPVFLAATVNGFDDARRPIAVGILVAPIVLSVFAHVTCKDIQDTAICPDWQVPAAGWRWPAVGCGIWATLAAFTAWVQLDMLEESDEEDAWHDYPWPLGRKRSSHSWRRFRGEDWGH